MSYTKITNPVTNRKVNISSKLGIKILNNYLNQLGGSEKQDLVSCSNKRGESLGSAAYKELYVTECADKLWKDESVGFNSTFSKEKCNDSIIAIMDYDVETFENEHKIQNTPESPKILRYGLCKDMVKTYKIEEKPNTNLIEWVPKNNPHNHRQSKERRDEIDSYLEILDSMDDSQVEGWMDLFDDNLVPKKGVVIPPQMQELLRMYEKEADREEREKQETLRLEVQYQERKRDIRNKNRAAYGSSKRGSNCVCIGPCEHQSKLACIGGICMNTKKCPVDPNDCGGKKFDKC